MFLPAFMPIFPRSAEKSSEVRTLIDRQREILQSAVSPLLDKGFKVTTEVEWDKDWCQAAVRASISMWRGCRA